MHICLSLVSVKVPSFYEKTFTAKNTKVMLIKFLQIVNI